MITSPSASTSRNSDTDLVWESSSSSSRNNNSAVSKPFLHSVPPSDPLRQAKRLPIKILKMLTARTGHILHPEYLQPLPSTPISPIEVRREFAVLLSYSCILLAQVRILFFSENITGIFGKTQRSRNYQINKALSYFILTDFFLKFSLDRKCAFGSGCLPFQPVLRDAHILGSRKTAKQKRRVVYLLCIVTFTS